MVSAHELGRLQQFTDLHPFLPAVSTGNNIINVHATYGLKEQRIILPTTGTVKGDLTITAKGGRSMHNTIINAPSGATNVHVESGSKTFLGGILNCNLDGGSCELFCDENVNNNKVCKNVVMSVDSVHP